MPAGRLGANEANVRLRSDVLGDVSLHVRVKESTASVRIEADSTAPFVGRSQELARDLAAQGLSLGHLDLERRPPDITDRQLSPQDGGSAQAEDSSARQPQEGEDWPPTQEPAYAPRRPASPEPGRTQKSRHDVTA